MILPILLILAQTTHVARGTRLRLEAESTSRSLAIVDEDAELPVVETRPPWVQVRYRDLKGWYLPGQADRGASILAPPEPDTSEQAWLDEARCRLGPAARVQFAGTFSLESDLQDGVLRERALRLMRAIETIYRERLGIEADREITAPQTVLLFADELAYRRLRDADAQLRDLPLMAGHARGDVAVLSSAGEAEDVLSLLAHELTHLLNRRHLGSELPPWLEEGLAEDLGWCTFSRDGSPLTGTLRERSEKRLLAGERFETKHSRSGPRVTVEKLLESRRRGGGLTLAELFELSRGEFAPRTPPGSGPRTGDAYPLSGLLVRFLLEPPRREGFQAFLRSIGSGSRADASLLLAHLRLDLESLEKGFAAHLDRLRPD